MVDRSEHIFTNHLLQVSDYQPVLNPSEDLIWPSLFLFISLILLAFVKAASFEKVIRILHSTFNKQVLQQLEREEFSPYKFYTSHTVNCNTFVDSIGIWAEIYNFRYRKSGSRQAVINYSLNSYDYYERSYTSPYSKTFCGTGGGGLYYRGRYYPMTTLFGCASFKIFA